MLSYVQLTAKNVTLAFHTGLTFDDQKPRVLQQLAAAHAGALGDLWRLLFVRLAWLLDAADQQGQGMSLAAAIGGSSRSRSSSSSGGSNARTQFLAAVGAPAAPMLAPDGSDGSVGAMETANQLVLVLKALMKAGCRLQRTDLQHSISGDGSAAVSSDSSSHSSSSSSSSSSSASINASSEEGQACLLWQQLIEALPFPEVLLLLLEQLLLDPSCLSSSEPFIQVVIDLLWHARGAAAVAEAAAD
jgi:hypothetical protein